MPSLKDMRGKAKEAGLMNLDKLIATRQHISTNTEEGNKNMQKEFLKTAVVYQISLRSFTREGTFRAAEKMLPHIRSIGVDVIYLCPFVKMDTDMDRSGWSPRQIKAGFDTPKNPYRIMDYTQLDPEYGTEDDLISFVKAAHKLGLRVVFDLVYLHCGPNNVMKDVIPDAFQKNPDGSVKVTEWKFPFLNYDSSAVRAYLIENMKQFLKDGCDGFRCDVGDQIPLDFWDEAFTCLRKIKPDLLAINEGTKEDYLKVFDVNYGLRVSYGIRSVLFGKKSLADFVNESLVPDSGRSKPRYLVFLENHDISTDDWENRMDRILPVEAGNAVLTALFLRPDVPVLYCGNEIADNALMTFFAPVEDPRRAYKTVDWGRALQPEGQKRLALIRKLAELRHTVPVFADGSMEYVSASAPDKILAFARVLPDGTRALVLINLANEEVQFTLKESAGERILLSDGVIPGEKWSAKPYGIYAAINHTK